MGIGCPLCKISKGEMKINNYLQNNKILFKNQKTFHNCRSLKNNLLKFDFYLIDYNICIEYDGEFHYIPLFNNEKYQENLIKTQYHDKIKTQYCLDNNIKLIRIPYWEFNNIETILEKEIF